MKTTEKGKCLWHKVTDWSKKKKTTHNHPRRMQVIMWYKKCWYSPPICSESKTSVLREGQVIPLCSLHAVGVTVEVFTCQFATESIRSWQRMNSSTLSFCHSSSLPPTSHSFKLSSFVLLSPKQATLTHSCSQEQQRPLNLTATAAVIWADQRLA